jgi:hypothetical protein
VARTNRNVKAYNNASLRRQLWAFSLFYCAPVFTFFFVSVFVIKDFMFIAVTGWCALYGLSYLWVALHESLGAARFGDLQLMLEEPAAAIGGRLTGLVPLPPALRTVQSVDATLICRQVRFHSKTKVVSGDTTVPESNELAWFVVANAGWSQTLQLPVVPTGQGAVVKVSMPIPAGQPATRMPAGTTRAAGARSGEDYWKWDLQLAADIPGVDLDITFPVHVLAAQPGAAPAAAMPAARPREASAAAVMKPAAAVPPVDASSLWVLVAVNLVPIAGVAFWGWRVQEIVFLYWIENLVIGAANILRMWTAAPRGVAEATGARLFTSGFFIMHYGLFCYGHGSFLASMFPAAAGGAGSGSLESVLVRMLADPYAQIAIGAIVVSHAYSYFHNYIGGGEYLHANVAGLMMRPYKRIAVTQVFIIVGGFVMLGVNSPVLAMVLFVGLKIAFDVYFHRREREMSAARR